jgi:hypothetical protein
MMKNEDVLSVSLVNVIAPLMGADIPQVWR